MKLREIRSLILNINLFKKVTVQFYPENQYIRIKTWYIMRSTLMSQIKFQLAAY